jgi:hypothetical protein
MGGMLSRLGYMSMSHVTTPARGEGRKPAEKSAATRKHA